MKAWVLHGVNDFRFEEMEEPVLGEDEVLVAVRAAGICGSDIPRVYGQGAYHYPLVLGHEFSGIVGKMGKHADPFWQDRRVGIFPLVPCNNCLPCQKKQYEMCRHYSYLGSRRDGGFAEYVAVPQDNLIALPQDVSYEEAAMLEPMAVAVHAMRKAMPDMAGWVVVCGLGTVGMLLLMFLKDAGIEKVLAVGNKEGQRQEAAQLGLADDCYFDSRIGDAAKWVMERTDGAGADVFFECVGRNETVLMALDTSAAGGKVCMVGNPSSDMVLPKAVYWKILRNQLTVTGTWNSSFLHAKEDDWHYALEKVRQGRVAPARLISHRFALEDLGQGFSLMHHKTEDYRKVMAVLGC